MVKLIGKRKNLLCCFYFWPGTNLKAIYNYSKHRLSKIDLKLVISNKSNVGVLNLLKK